jgi:hypothetical protein
MTSPSNAEPDEGRGLTVRWNAEDWAKLKDAAEAETARQGFRVTPTDIIRSGAIRRADEILNPATSGS